MDSVGSVQFQRALCSSLYLFSMSIGPLQCIVNINCRIFVCCTCHFQSGSLFIVYFGFLCLQVSSVSNFHPDTGGKSGHLFQLTCSVVSWGRRDTTNITVVCGECLQCMDHAGFATAHRGMCILGLHYSGFRLHCRDTVQRGPCIGGIS